MRVYVDSNIFIYAIEGHSSFAGPSQAMLRALQGNPGSGATSELTLAEVLSPSAHRQVSPRDKRRYLEALVWGGHFDLLEVKRSILLDTAKLRRLGLKMSLPDAIHACRAVAHGCRMFVSNDHGVRLPSELALIAPTDEGLASFRQVFA